MSSEKVNKLLAELKMQLQSEGDDSEETQRLLAQLEATLNKNAERDDGSYSDVIDTALRLETHFAVEHPVAEKTIREIINILGRMGI